MSMLLSSIWTQEFNPSSRCYDSIFDASEPTVKQVYELATSGSEIHELDIWGATADVVAVELQVLLEHAANKGDFTEVLHREIGEALVFPVRSDHVVDPWDFVINTYITLTSIIMLVSCL